MDEDKQTTHTVHKQPMREMHTKDEPDGESYKACTLDAHTPKLDMHVYTDAHMQTHT